MALYRSVAATYKIISRRECKAVKGLFLSTSSEIVRRRRLQQLVMTTKGSRQVHDDASTRTTVSSHEEGQAATSWWKDIMTMSQVVPNTGSIARDVLAAERTFLAWSRTGLGFVGAGTALFTAFHQSDPWNEEATMNTKSDHSGDGKSPALEPPRATSSKDHEPNSASSSNSIRQHLHFYPTLASALLVGNGAFLLAFATRRYLRTVTLMTRHMDNPLFPIDAKGTLTAVAVTASSTLVSLGLVLSMARDTAFTSQRSQ